MPVTESKRISKRNDVLKLIAIITMFIDHVGALIYTDLRFLRMIGRISFPIFAYMLAMGFIHTSNRKKYGLRLFLFALISQPAYMAFPLSYYNRINPIMLNVMFLLFLGLIYLQIFETMSNNFKSAIEKFKQQYIKDGIIKFLIGLILLILFVIVTFLPEILTIHFSDVNLTSLNISNVNFCSFSLSYGTYGLLLILIFYLFHNKVIPLLLSFVALTIFSTNMDISHQSAVLNPLNRFTDNFNNYIHAFFSKKVSGYIPYIYEVSTKKEFVTKYFFTFKSPFLQSLSFFGVLTIIALKDIKAAFRMPKWFAYVFYPAHLVLIYLFKIYVLKM